MRGRGIARGLAAQANRHDPFRSRPPNTSRPPSMHVDDFMKLEQKSEQHRDSPDESSPVRRDVSVMFEPWSERRGLNAFPNTPF